MKAILVIDVQMTEDGKHIYDSCPVWNEKICGCNYNFMTGHKGCPLKPMPRKLDANDWHRMFDGTYKEREAKGYGWNACLKELDDEID